MRSPNVDHATRRAGAAFAVFWTTAWILVILTVLLALEGYLPQSKP